MAYDPRLASAGTATPDPPPPPPPPPESAMAAPTETESSDGTAAAPTQEQQSDSYKLRFCTVCASNQNRSMEAHLRLSTAPSPFPVISFGTGSLVRLPGPSITQPNVYNFNTTSYSQMYEELYSKDERLYRNNGLLNMLERNRNLKWGPERFQDWVPGMPRVDHVAKGDKGALGTEGGVVDVIITCEERCWDAVVDDLMNKGSLLNRPVHVFNVDIKDNHEEALVGGKAILELANRLNEAAIQERKANNPEGWENGTGEARRSFDEKVPEILAAWQEKWPNLPALWTLAWL
ncbi:RNA polymerase II subunit A C-terminal domain phosphatase ssu72 [Aspergillus parasiticus]|uniref:RNA polymerase II subunit A C-terminal domain phosphatase SSU72 n=5 Tax=Aspergillus subgen. Circumdati TaxID=2720871 RepID=A0A2G7EL11_9EURO|nr:RNA polymerase II subunit A C-terminal domain phosphatase ssu72 [Aspergillus parasiticus]KAB8269712.1 RNA polymerase II subunit A C-terminal domain phosphatase ssu72 [Aspergillus minisclerotigenes]KAE8311525.1 RNA polymerase II subunit A C-terminal domain phosphatase ssu72 [Aspergillus transmontanensis]KAE8321552.1 RNA polymerase II subunit A C-terminal domain phosphatase ssu72 [Aspergillus sergii]KAE8339131.1 RNA polymerase II subunit A C-terminal domain phosphatase ssu72 [Aspergillus arach